MINKLYTKTILKHLSKLEHGQFTLTTPDGKNHEFSGAHSGPSAKLKVSRWSVFTNLATRGDLGFAEDYRDGHWQTDDLKSLILLVLINRNSLDPLQKAKPFFSRLASLSYLFTRNSIRQSKKNIHAHYDLGNDFYALWLDPSMTYSSALYKTASDSLDHAQTNKYQRIINELESDNGTMLEIGCGWGGFAEQSLQQGDYDYQGITLSEQQHAFTKQRLDNAGKVALQDYRHQQGVFNNIVSIEMFEAVGEQYWKTYFSKLKSLLAKKGKAVIQTITINNQDFPRYRKSSDFIRSYIFPGGMLPSPNEFKKQAESCGLKIVNQFHFGQDYARTLEHWLENFENNLATVKQLGFDDGFIRLWRFYLAACYAGFKAERTDVMQVKLIHA